MLLWVMEVEIPTGDRGAKCKTTKYISRTDISTLLWPCMPDMLACVPFSFKHLSAVTRRDSKKKYSTRNGDQALVYTSETWR